SPGDLPPAGGGWAGQDQRASYPSGKDQRPLQCTHPAHGATDHGRPGIDTQGIDEGLFGTYGVPDGQPRKTTAPGTPVRSRGGRPRTSLAATQGVGGHHEVAVGVQGTTGTDQTVPPPRGGMPRLGRTGDAGEIGRASCR